MAFAGVGGSANAGSITGFLFINADGVSKGLNDATGSIRDFNAKSDAAAKAAAGLSASTSDLATKTAALSSAQSAHASNLGDLTSKQAALSSAQSNYNRVAADTQTVEDRLQKARNQNADVANKVQRAQTRVQLATEALTKAQADAIVVGTKAEKIAVTTAQVRQKDAAESVKLSQIQAKAAATNVLAQKEELRELVKTGAPIADIKAQIVAVAEAQGLSREAAIQLGAAQVKAASAQRVLTQATADYAVAEKAALASIDPLIIKERDKAAAQLASAKAAQDAAQINVRNETINLSALRHNEEIAKSSLATAKAETDAAKAKVAASQKVVNAAQKEADAALAANAKITASAKEAEGAQVAAAEATAAKTVQAFGKMATTVGLGLAVGLGVATAQFVSFDEEMANVGAISPDLNNNLDALKTHVLDLSTQFGKSATDIAKGLFTIAQAGVPADEVAGVLDLATKAAVAGRTSVEDAVKPLIGLINAYGLTVEQAGKQMDVLFQAAQDGVFDFKDLSSQLGDNLSIASALNVPVTDLAAAYVVLTKRSNSLAESTTQVNGIMNSFLKPTEDLNQAIQDYTGQTATAFFRTHDFADVLQLVNQLFQDDADSAGKLFPNLRAIRGIYGLTADEVKAYRVEVLKLQAEQLTGGATAQVLARQQQAAAFQFRQSREELRKAAILIGEDAAPAFLQLAKTVGNVAQAFNNLPQATRGTIVSFAEIATGSLLAVGGIIKFTSFLIGIKRNIGDAGTAVIGFIRNLRSMNNVLSALATGIAVAGIALLVAALIGAKQQADRDRQAFDDLNTSIANAGAQSADFRLNGLGQAADDLDKVKAGIDGINTALTEQSSAIENSNTGLIGSIESTFESHKNAVINMFGGDAKSAVDNLADAEARVNTEFEKITQAFNNPNVDTTALANAFQPLIDAVLAAPTPENIDAFVNGAEDILSHLDKFPKSADDAAKGLQTFQKSAQDAAKDINSFFPTADDSAQSFIDSIKSLTTAGINLNSKFGDLSNPLAAIQRLLNSTGESAFATYLKMQKLGFVKFNGAEREALRVADGLAKAQAQVDKVDASIQQNNDDISMWQSRIDFVDQTLGDHNDTLQVYIDKLDAGTITQDEFNSAVTDGTAHRAFQDLVDLYKSGAIDCATYNQALDDGNFVVKRSEGGLRDEKIEQLKNLHALRLAIEAHDKADKKYKDLTDDQRAFLGAMADSTVQTTLQTAALLAMLEAVHAIPKGTTTKFLIDASQANPVLATMLDGLNVFDGTNAEADVNLKGGEGVISQLTHINGVKERALKEGVIKVSVKGKDADNKLQQYLDLNGKTLADSGVKVEFEINGRVYAPTDPNNPLTQYLDQTKDVPPKVDSSVVVNVTDTGNLPSEGLSRGGPVEGINAVGDAADKVDGKKVDVTVAATGTDKAKTDLGTTKAAADDVPKTVTVSVDVSSTAVDLGTIQKALADFVITAELLAKNAGSGYAAFFPVGVSENAPAAAISTASYLISALQIVLTDMYNEGKAVGGYFDSGIIAGIGDQLTQVALAGQAAGQSAVNGAKSAIKPGSPSKVTMALGHSFVDGLLVSIRSRQSEAETTSRRFAEGMTSAFQRQFSLKDTAKFHAATVDAKAVAASRQIVSFARPGQTGGHTFNVQPTITVNGGATNDETAEVIWNRLESGLIRFAAQTGAGE